MSNGRTPILTRQEIQGNLTDIPQMLLKSILDNTRVTTTSLSFIDPASNQVYARELRDADSMPGSHELAGIDLQRSLGERRKKDFIVEPLDLEKEVMEAGSPIYKSAGELPRDIRNWRSDLEEILAIPLRFNQKYLGVILAGSRERVISQELLVEEIQDAVEEEAFSFAGLWLFVTGRSDSRHPFITGDTEEWERFVEIATKSAKFEFPVYIYGERGTGKELAADFIHHLGGRSENSFIKVNCASIPENISESELFGHRAGAFTGATENKKGKFLLADGGTLLLDEVSELSLENQKKLLRVLQTGEFTPVGADESRKVDVRIICSTNSYLEDAVRMGSFRSDLFDRLNVLKLELPPLRRWKGKISELTDIYFREVSGKNRKDLQDVRVEPEAYDALKEYSFPGNCRELYNIVRKLFVEKEGDKIGKADVERVLDKLHSARVNGARTIPDTFSRIFSNAKNPSVLKDRAEYLFLKRALEEKNGDVDQISDEWDCSRQNIYRLCNKHDLTPKEFRT